MALQAALQVNSDFRADVERLVGYLPLIFNAFGSHKSFLKALGSYKDRKKLKKFVLIYLNLLSIITRASKAKTGISMFQITKIMAHCFKAFKKGPDKIANLSFNFLVILK